jgi:predicted Zn-dependent peptidase
VEAIVAMLDGGLVSPEEARSMASRLFSDLPPGPPPEPELEPEPQPN